MPLPLSLVLALSLAVVPQSNPNFRQWNRPVQPFRIAGSLYYVGSENLTSLLLTSPAGHILIDGGCEETAPQIIENIRRLGFRLEDVRILLSTHAHSDHAGGLAHLKAVTGARLYAGAKDVEALARGGRGDFAWGDDLPFPPVKADVAVNDGEELRLGPLAVHAIATPGHTKGCTSWVFTVQDGGKTLRVLMIGGISVPGYRLVNNERYPAIADDYRATFRALRATQCDVCLEGHGFLFDLEARRKGTRPFVDPAALAVSLDRAETDFNKRLAEQRDSGTAGQRDTPYPESRIPNPES